MALLVTDPVCFARDSETSDLVFPLRLVSGLEAVAIGIRTRILTCRGEWFLDLDIGIPYLPDGDAVPARDAILGQRFDPIKTRAAFLREILSTPGVFEVPILQTSFDGATRILRVSWVARTRFGDTEPDTLTKVV